MKLSTAQFKKFSSGFTLIELLVVIAILGILVVGLIVAIDPADKIAAANDARVLTDFGSIARAAEGYSTVKGGGYPNSATFSTDILNNGDLKIFPTAPTNYTYTISTYSVSRTGAQAVDATCTSGTTCLRFTLMTDLRSKKYTGNTKLVYDSGTGHNCQMPAATLPAAAFCN